MCVCTFLIVGQMARLICTKLGAQIHLDPGSVSGKSRSEHHRHENGGVIGADSLRPQDRHYSLL